MITRRALLTSAAAAAVVGMPERGLTLGTLSAKRAALSAPPVLRAYLDGVLFFEQVCDSDEIAIPVTGTGRHELHFELETTNGMRAHHWEELTLSSR